MFQTDVYKFKTNILYSIPLFLKSCRISDNVGKYCTAGQAADENIVQPGRPQMKIRHMMVACLITKDK